MRTSTNYLIVLFTLHSFATAHYSQSQYRLLRLIVLVKRYNRLFA